MKVLIPGHEYFVSNFGQENYPNTVDQFIKFIYKEPDKDGNLRIICDGTTNEEILRVLIDRLRFLDSKLASRYTIEALKFCEDALNALNLRTKDREERGIKGTMNP